MISGVHLQAYIGRKASHQQIDPKVYRKKADEPMVMNMAIDHFVENQNEVESFKQITRIEINC